MSRISARLFPALCGCALLLLLFAHLRRRASPSGIALGVGLVALQADAVVLSRMAVPEMPAMLASLAAFVALTGGSPTPRRLVLAGMLTAITVGLKVTMLPLVAIFGLVACLVRDGVDGGRRWRDLGSFAMGLLLVAVPAAALALGALVLGLGDTSDLEYWAASRARFLGVGSFYSVVARPIESPLAPVLNPAGLAFWAAALAWTGGPASDPAVRRGMRAATLWALLYVGVVSGQAYSPERYLVHVLVPLAVLAAFAATRLETLGASGVARGIDETSGLRRALAIGILCFPSAVLLAPVAGALLGAAGAPVERLSIRLLALVASWLALGVAITPVVRAAHGVRFLIGLPLVGITLWFTAWIVAERPPPFWIESAFVRAGALRLGLLVLTAGATLLAIRALAEPGRRAWVGLALSCAWSVAWAVHLAPGFVEPRHSVRDASRSLAAAVGDTEIVLQNRAEGLFLDNRLRYRWIWSPFTPKEKKRHWSQIPHDFLVTELPFGGDDTYLSREYELVHSFTLYAAATRWSPPRPSELCPDGAGQCVGLFRKRSR